jgi:hypothetical protein
MVQLMDSMVVVGDGCDRRNIVVPWSFGFGVFVIISGEEEPDETAIRETGVGAHAC